MRLKYRRKIFKYLNKANDLFCRYEEKRFSERWKKHAHGLLSVINAMGPRSPLTVDEEGRASRDFEEGESVYYKEEK